MSYQNMIFIVLLLLIAAAYYVGVKTDATAVTNGVVSVIQTATGRNANNQFAAYPQ